MINKQIVICLSVIGVMEIKGKLEQSRGDWGCKTKKKRVGEVSLRKLRFVQDWRKSDSYGDT